MPIAERPSSAQRQRYIGTTGRCGNTAKRNGRDTLASQQHEDMPLDRSEWRHPQLSGQQSGCRSGCGGEAAWLRRRRLTWGALLAPLLSPGRLAKRLAVNMLHVRLELVRQGGDLRLTRAHDVPDESPRDRSNSMSSAWRCSGFEHWSVCSYSCTS